MRTFGVIRSWETRVLSCEAQPPFLEMISFQALMSSAKHEGANTLAREII